MFEIPDVAVGRPVPRGVGVSGKPLSAVQYVWHPCKACGEMSAVPLGIKGFLSSNLGKCPFCGRPR